MSNFLILLKWEITSIGKYRGSYSHLNSLMKRSISAIPKQSEEMVSKLMNRMGFEKKAIITYKNEKMIP